MGKIKGLAVRWGPPVLWMAAIFVASATPSNHLPAFGPLDTVVKKTGHAVAYAILGTLFRRALGWEKRQVLGAWFLSVLYALADEFHQSFVPGRHPSLIDAFGFDGMGAALALWIGWRYFRPSAPPASQQPG